MPRITSAEAASRLGVKVETLYAYVSRGILRSERVSGGKGTSFDLEEVERLARNGTRRQGRAVNVLSFRTVRSSVSHVDDERLFYRDEDVETLSRERTFSEVASLLWTGDVQQDEPMVAPSAMLAALRRAVGPVGADDGIARLRIAVALAGSRDPLRFDLDASAVAASGRTILACMAAVVDPASPSRDGVPVPRRLWPEGTLLDDPVLAEALDAAMILLMDHGLATSTVAARVAASTRADPYAVVSAGLAAFEGPLHGQASAAAHADLELVMRGRPAASVVQQSLRRGRPVPGFGHPLYPRGDPRATRVLDLLARSAHATDALAALDAVRSTLAGRAGGHPNIDMALAVLTHAAGLPPDAGELVFAVARAVGWVAHALEEYQEDPLRWRGQS